MKYQNLGKSVLVLFAHQLAAGYLHERHWHLFDVVGRVNEVFDAVAGAPAPSVPADSELL